MNRSIFLRASALSERLALFLLPLLLASCSIPISITNTPRASTPSPSAIVIPDMPVQTWGIESCGAGSLSSVLQHYGDPTTMAEWDSTLPKTRGGVMTIDLLIAARQKGYDAQIVTGTPARVTEELQNGRPVILMLQVVEAWGKRWDFFHYIVADGIDPARQLIRTQFGDGSARWVALSKLEKNWKAGGYAAILIRPRTNDEKLAEALRAAVALEEQGKVGEAAERYRALTRSHPDSPTAWTNYGNTQMQLGANDEAERSFRRALELEPESRDALNNLAWLLYQQKRLEEAERYARKAASQPGPDVYLILDTLARVLAAKGSCAEAMRTFREAIDAVPQSRGSIRAGIESGMADAQRSCS